MKKLITVFGIIILLAALRFLFIRSEAPTLPPQAGETKVSDQELMEQIVSGKWVNKSGGYRLNRESDAETERYKTLSFYKDKTALLDSAKQKYTADWNISNGQVVITFHNSKIAHMFKITDPNSMSTYYKMQDTIINLGIRTGYIKDDVLIMSDGFKYENTSMAMSGMQKFWEFSAFPNLVFGNIIMILVGLIFIFLAIRYDYEPLLLVPIGMGIIIGNIPMFQVIDFNLKLGIYEPGSVMNFLYQGVVQGWYPPLIFLGIGAMTDFSSLISSPRLMLLGAATQIGIFATFIGAIYLGFNPSEAAAIGIIGGADGPTAIFTASKLANGLNVLTDGSVVKNLIGPIAIAAYSYMALVPVIQPPIIKLLTTKKERLIRMRPPRAVSHLEKIMFPIIGLLFTTFIAPTALPLLGMLFFGNLLKESGVTKRLANTASNPLIDTITILLGLTVGASTQADVFLTSDSILIFILGALSFMVATAGGVLFAKLMNVLSPKNNPVNPMVGAAGVSAVPDSARVVQTMGLKEDPSNHLLMHAMAPNVAGVIGSAVAAGIMLSFFM